jgi:hypothetical protein
MYSLGEIESQCKKAARGVGLSWGVAEEAGIVARNLSEVGLPGAIVIYNSLKYFDGSVEACLNSKEEIFQKRKCPILGLTLGISLLDRINLIEDRHSWDLGKIVSPLALVGVLLRLRGCKYSFIVEWRSFKIVANQFGLKMSGNNQNPKLVNKLKIDIARSENISLYGFSKICNVSDAIWVGLSKMVEKTYVPATEISRIRGAGAGTLDND